MRARLKRLGRPWVEVRVVREGADWIEVYATALGPLTLRVSGTSSPAGDWYYARRDGRRISVLLARLA